MTIDELSDERLEGLAVLVERRNGPLADRRFPMIEYYE